MPAVGGTWFEQQSYYVGKHGLDTNDGKSVEKAFATIGAAIAAVEAQTPSSSNRFVIHVTDAGLYNEVISIPTYTVLFAPAAQLQNRITMSGDYARLIFDSYYGPGSMITAGAAGLCVKANKLQPVGAGHAIELTSGDVTLDVGELDCSYSIWGIELTGGIVRGRIGHINASNRMAIISVASSGEINLDIGSVDNVLTGKIAKLQHAGGSAVKYNLRIGRATGGVGGVGIDMESGSAIISIGELTGYDEAYNISGDGNLYMFANKMSGAETSTTTGDVKVTKAGG